MENRFAVWFAIAVTVALAVDAVLIDWHYTLFWARKGLQLIDLLAFWR